LIYKCGGIDKRTIEKFEKVRIPPRRRLCTHFLPYRDFCPSVGQGRFPQSTIFCARTFLARQPALFAAQNPFNFYAASISLVQLLTRSKGSRRVGQGFFQVCVGS
jgi:hypothetical protein